MYIFSYGTLASRYKYLGNATMLAKMEIDRSEMYPRLVTSKTLNQIEGVLLEVTNEEMDEADEYEGFPVLYDKMIMSVTCKGEQKFAWVYI